MNYSFKYRMMQAYEDLEINDISFKVCKIKVPVYEKWERLGCILTNPNKNATPEYELLSNASDYKGVKDEGTVYDENILGYIKDFDKLKDSLLIPVIVKVSNPLYKQLDQLGLIVE